MRQKGTRMKYQLYRLLLPLTLFACGGEEQGKVTQAKQNIELRNLFDLSHIHSEAELLSETKRRLSKKEALSTVEAERCWEREEKRPNIRNSCLILWAIKSNSSPLLEKILADQFLEDPLLATAAILHGKTMEGWSYHNLLLLLKKLKKAPLWLRAKAVLAWLGTRQVEIVQANTIIAAISPTDAIAPVDYETLLAVLRKINPGEEANIIREHCSTAAIGEVRLRCWRFLSAISTKASDDLFLPRSRDEDWDYFRRNMPHRTHILENR
jgi:hypothetical protein